MNALAVRLLGGLLLGLALAAGSYWAGDQNRNNAWLAKNAKVERDAHAKYEVEVVRGDRAAGSFLTAHQAMQTQFEDLTEKFHALRHRVPLVVAAPGLACSGPGSAEPHSPQADTKGVGDSPVLSAAVWMWNSALTGTDQPAGACSAVDTSEAACAVASTLDLDVAWANHAVNAQLCAEDRLAHQRLIDFLTTKAKP